MPLAHAADLPTRLTHAGVAVVGRDIYVAGGYIGTSSTGTGWSQKFGVTDVWRYNVDTNVWTAVTPKLPKEVAGGGLVLLGRELHWVSGNNNLRQDIGDHFVLNLDKTGFERWKLEDRYIQGHVQKVIRANCKIVQEAFCDPFCARRAAFFAPRASPPLRPIAAMCSRLRLTA